MPEASNFFWSSLAVSNEVSFTATVDDYVAANRLWHGRSIRQRWLLWLSIASFAVAASYFVFLVFTGDPASHAASEAAPMLLFAGIVFFVRMLTPLTFRRQVRRMMAQNTALQEAMHCHWNEEGIKFSGTNGSADLRWTRLHKWLMDDSVFVFLQTDRLMFVVPRRVLDEAQEQSLHSAAVASGLGRA